MHEAVAEQPVTALVYFLFNSWLIPTCPQSSCLNSFPSYCHVWHRDCWSGIWCCANRCGDSKIIFLCTKQIAYMSKLLARGRRNFRKAYKCSDKLQQRSLAFAPVLEVQSTSRRPWRRYRLGARRELWVLHHDNRENKGIT
jgi:hypothetical protein